MKKTLGVFLVACFCLGIFGSTFAAEKFAYVDLGKIFADYGKRKDYEKALLDKENAFSSDIDKKGNELKQMNEKLSMLSEKEKSAQEKDLQSKFDSFQEFRKQKLLDLRKDQDEKMNEIFKDIQDTVTQYAQKEGYTFVFSGASVIYQDKKLEITDQVLSMLNSKYTTKK